MKTQERGLVGIVGVLVCSLLGGCLERALAPLNPCLVSGVTAQVQVNNIDKVDLLFLIDNSSSMEDKQKNLREHVPQLVETLVNGKRGPNDPHPFPPVKDLHIAVVDCDMGLVGVSGIGGCNGFGDDGLFQHVPHPSSESPTCDASYPTYLSYVASASASPTAMKLEQDFGCIANVGAMGCGFEQQLEAVLKSLWPSVYTDPKTGKIDAMNPVRFLTDSADPMEALGHGDSANAGFQRNDPAQGESLLAIIVLSDEEDGSTADMGLYQPVDSAPSWLEPITQQNLNLRPLIGKNRDHLYPVTRYIDAFKALRPDNPQLVVYAAITGVPLDLVNDAATAEVDFTNQTQRDAYYDNILNDPRMQAQVDDSGAPGDLRAQYVCETSFGHATPGKRFVEVAKGMGENSTVYSICENDYTPAINHIIDIIAKQLGAVCLPKPLVRDSTGVVKCNVVWELPNASMPHSEQAPTTCADRPYLMPPAAGHDAVGPTGGQLCNVTQLPVINDTIPAGDGWYYDNFSSEAHSSCNAATPQRVAFSVAAKPPTGVTVKLECLNETQQVVDTRSDIVAGSATIGSSCEVSVGMTGVTPDSLCEVKLKNGMVEKTMFCHPKTNTCAKSCASDADCPNAWVCDQRPETLAATVSAARPKGSAICVNPTCGTN